MVSTFPPRRGDLPGAVIDLAMRLGAQGGPSSSPDGSIVSLSQTGRMLRALGKDDWMFFTARQTIETGACNFAWRARFAPFGLVSACDALENGVGRLDVTALGFIPIARTPHTAALMRGELLRYLAELAWAPDAMLENTALRWRESGSGDLIVGAGDGPSAVEISLGLDSDGRIATAFAPDRPRSATEPNLPTPWRGRFSDYRLHLGRWLPFAGEVAWEIDGKEEVYWQGKIESWATSSPCNSSAPSSISMMPRT